LEALYLSFNSLESVYTDTFMDLPSLELLQLDDNRIMRIERHAFMNMDLLKKLDLRGNKLTVISDETFQNLPQLELLDLAYNELQSLDFSMLDQVSHSSIPFVQCGDQLGCPSCSHVVINLKHADRALHGSFTVPWCDIFIITDMLDLRFSQ
jgi:Leucine-rich repeat (LRR) protein